MPLPDLSSHPETMEKTRAALSIPHILENILCRVDQKTLLTSGQRVSRFWNDVISSSAPVQRHLFFLPDVGRKDTELNPMLLSIFPHWFTDDFPDWFKTYLATNNVSPSELVDCAYPQHIDWSPNCKAPVQPGDPDLPKRWFRVPPMPSLIRDPIMQAENASWRRMLLQQPPIAELVTFFLDEEGLYDGRLSQEQGSSREGASHGVLIGDLWQCNKPGDDEAYWLEWGTMPHVLWDSADHHVPTSFCVGELEADDKRVLEDALVKHGMIVVKPMLI